VLDVKNKETVDKTEEDKEKIKQSKIKIVTEAIFKGFVGKLNNTENAD
jgi:hypothetical protein